MSQEFDRRPSSTSSSIQKDDTFQLKKEISLVTAIALIGGSIIGSGIFMTPGKILEEVGSVGAMFMIWVLAALIALACALSYIELALCVRESGGEYAYNLRAFGDWVGYLTAWATVVISKPGSMLLLSYTCSEYLIKLFYPMPCEPSDYLMKCVTVVIIFLVTIVNIVSVKLSTNIIKWLFYTKVLALLVCSVTGLIYLGKGNTENFKNAFEGSSTSWTSYSVALYSGMWNFDGWNQLSSVTEELKDPVRNFPIAVWTSIPLVAVIYLLVNAAYLTVMTPTEITTGSSVAVTFAYRTLGSFNWIIPVAVVCSTLGTATGSMFTAGRISNVASRRSHLPKVMSYIDTIRYTPSLAIMVNCLISCIFVLPDASSFSTVLDYFSFTSWIVYGLACLSVIVLRFKAPYKDLPRPYKVPLIIPLLSALVSFYLVVAPVIQDPNIGYLLVTLLLFGGLIFYLPIHVFKVTWFDGFMDKLTLFLQKFLQLAPPEGEFGGGEKQE